MDNQYKSDLDDLGKYLVDSSLVKLDNIPTEKVRLEVRYVIFGMQMAIIDRERRIAELETKGRKLLEAFAMGDEWINEYNEFEEALKASE